MNNSGCNALLELMNSVAKGRQRPSVFIGKVRSVSPLTVETVGVLLTAADLLVDQRFLQSSANASDILTVGGQVALVSADMDKFILLCKVVKP